jgi:hypothetical protein
MGNSIAGLFLGGYLLAAIGTGNGPNLVSAISDERGFIRWFFALLIIIGVSRYEPKIFAPLMSVVFIAMFLKAQEKGQLTVFFDDFTKLFEG